jgi:L-lysine exporter family protein LysE/ArgO
MPASAILTDLGAGFASGGALIVAIGAQNAFVLRQGLLREHAAAVALICALADALLIFAGVAGLGALISGSADADQTLNIAKTAGAAFLLAYGAASGLRAARSRTLTPTDHNAKEPSPSKRAVLATCLAFTFLNPHVYLDTVVLLGSLANQRGADGRWLFWAGATTASFTWFFALALGARLLAPLFAKPTAWKILDGLVALLMLALGAGLLVG